MGLFKERAANAKKVIALQNEIFTLKNKLQQTSELPKDCEKCKEVEELLAFCKEELKAAQEEVKSLKATLKKLRADNRKLSKKASPEGE